MLKIVTLAVTLAACAWAASPLGSASSKQPFDLNGATIPRAGVPSWPIAAGDVIATHEAPATIVFQDGSRVVLAEGSKARIEAQGGKSILRLLEGSGQYRLSAHPSLSIYVLDKPVIAKSAGKELTLFCVDPDKGKGGDKDDGGNNGKGGDKGKPPHPSPSRH